jgi:hypothetical protein
MRLTRPAACFVVTAMLATAIAACAPSGIVVCSLNSLVTPADSVRRTGQTLYGMVRTIDGESRPAGALPPNLNGIGALDLRTVDVWGRALRYQVDGREYELRSAGPDGDFDTADDIFVTGRLGRNRPCEWWQGRSIATGGPPCDAPPGEVYPLCPALDRADPYTRLLPATRDDSIRTFGERLVRVAWRIEGAGREYGALPVDWRQIPVWGRGGDGGWELVDLWDTPVRYTRDGLRYELRAAGPDRVLDTLDDIVVTGELGTLAPCEYRANGTIHHCAQVPPDCPTP